MTSGSYLRHYGPPIIALYIAEGHLRALVLVDLELGMIHEWNLVHRYYTWSALRTTGLVIRRRTPVLNDDSRHTNGSVSSHLHWAQSTTLVTLLAQLRSSICNQRSQLVGTAVYLGRCITYLVGDHLLQ